VRTRNLGAIVHRNHPESPRFCLETRTTGFRAPPAFPTVILRPGQTFNSTTVFAFLRVICQIICHGSCPT